MASLAHPVANLYFDEVSTVIQVKANYPRLGINVRQHVLITLTPGGVEVSDSPVSGEDWLGRRLLRLDKLNESNHPVAEWLTMIVIGV